MPDVRFAAALFFAWLLAFPLAARAQIVLPPGEEAASPNEGSVFFVGNATVIIRHAGFTILTDPNFLHKGDHVHLGFGLTAQRLTDPAISIDELPPVDLVVLSHYHGDHFDPLVEEKLDRRIPIVTTRDAVDALGGKGFENLHALEKWGRVTVRKGEATLAITAMPARHGPPVLNRPLPETMGSLLEFGRAGGEPSYRIYISGDTLVYDELREIAERHPRIDLGLLHLGGTRALGVLVTMDAKQGVEAMRIIDPALTIPIHYDDYDRFTSGLEDFLAAVKEAGLDGRVHVLARGETYRFRATAR